MASLGHKELKISLVHFPGDIIFLFFSGRQVYRLFILKTSLRNLCPQPRPLQNSEINDYMEVTSEENQVSNLIKQNVIAIFCIYVHVHCIYIYIYHPTIFTYEGDCSHCVGSWLRSSSESGQIAR